LFHFLLSPIQPGRRCHHDGRPLWPEKCSPWREVARLQGHLEGLRHESFWSLARGVICRSRVGFEGSAVYRCLKAFPGPVYAPLPLLPLPQLT